MKSVAPAPCAFRECSRSDRGRKRSSPPGSRSRVLTQGSPRRSCGGGTSSTAWLASRRSWTSWTTATARSLPGFAHRIRSRDSPTGFALGFPLWIHPLDCPLKIPGNAAPRAPWTPAVSPWTSGVRLRERRLSGGFRVCIFFCCGHLIRLVEREVGGTWTRVKEVVRGRELHVGAASSGGQAHREST